MFSGIMRFAFVFFVLGCVAAVGWTSKEKQGTRATDMAMQSWLPQMCSAWNVALDRGNCGVEAAMKKASPVRALPASTAEIATTGEAVWKKTEKAEARELPFRRSETAEAIDG